MPNVNLINVPLYNPMHPYHWEYDNLPLRAILERENLINSAVDINSQIIRDAAGNQGTVSNRLNQSIEENGDIKTVAIDEALHNIGWHTDGEYEGVDYVRMLEEERSKLDLIEDEANNFSIQIETPSNIILFDSGTLSLSNSDTVTWEVSNNVATANLAFPIESVHRHYYNIAPDHANIITPDYKNYVIPYTPIEDSVRVYVNGVKLNPDEAIWIPFYSTSWNPGEDWMALTYVVTDDELVLSSNLSVYDKVSIDFDISLS